MFLASLFTDGEITQVVDVGCAEGYYAIGVALRMPHVNVLAYDVDADARRLCQEMAKANGVGERILIKERCEPELLAPLLERRGLLICDCEGFEEYLFTPGLIGALKNWTVLIETHQVHGRDTGGTLAERFRPTHRMQVIRSIEDQDKGSYYMIDEAVALSHEGRARLFTEERDRNHWLCLVPV